MASVQEPGMVLIKAVRVDGKEVKVIDAHVAQLAPAGGSPDAALANVSTPEKRWYIAPQGPIMRPNDHIAVIFTAEGADGIDASDCVWLIPVTEYNADGSVRGSKFISRGQFTDPAPADYTTVANIPVVVGAYKVTEAGLRIGGGPIYLDIQDDT